MRSTVADIAQLIRGEFVGDGSVEIHGCSGVSDAKAGEITFLANPKYLSQAQTTKASAVIVPRQIKLPGKTVIKAEDPSWAFTKVLEFFAAQEGDAHPKGVHPTAMVASDATLGKNVAVGAYAVIEAGAMVGEGTVIYPQVYVGAKATVGKGCLIYPKVVLRERVVVGDRVVIHSGSVIGCDGYGYITVEGKHVKIPQLGTVVIENDVEIGANVTVDRARFDKTMIGEGTKIDNLVHIAHNVVVGKHCLIVAQVGISGSSRLGDYVVLAGQVGVVGHLTIGDHTVVAAQSGVSKSIAPGQQVFGSPAQPIKEAFRNHAHVQRLEQYVQLIKDLRKRVEILEQGKTSN